MVCVVLRRVKSSGRRVGIANGKQTSEKEKNNHIQDVSDSAYRHYADTEYDYNWYFGCKADYRNARRVFGQYDEPVGGEQKSHPAK